MSITWITRMWASPEPGGSGERLLLVALADLASEEGICRPSIPTLARRCAVDPRTVRRYLRRLEADGFIESEMRSGRSTLYRLLQRDASTQGSALPPDTRDRGREPAVPPDAPDRSPRTGIPARTCREPSSNRVAARVSTDDRMEQRSDELAGLLVKRGVHEPVAIRLVRRHDHAYIQRHVAHYDALCTGSGARRGPGWLVASIQDDYTIPASGPEPPRLFTYKEALAWIERSGIRLSPASPLTRWFEPIKQPGGKALFKLSAASNQPPPQRPSAQSRGRSANVIVDLVGQVLPVEQEQ